MDLVKKFGVIPLSLLLVYFYVKMTVKNLGHRVIDPGDGSPEVVEVVEEPPTTKDYLVPLVVVGVLVSLAVYFNNSGIQDFVSSPVKNAVRSFSAKPTVPVVTSIQEAIRSGPANF